MTDECRIAFSLTDELSLVTGGGTGIGLGIARCLKAAGARVVITGRRADVLEAAARDHGFDSVLCDVTDAASVAKCAERVHSMAGAPSILVNAAGNHLKKPAVEMSVDEFDTVLRTHLSGAFSMTRALAPAMIERGHGSIVFISSMTAFMGMPLVAGYAAAKSGVTGLVRTLSAEFAPRGVRVNAVAPGWIDTPMLRKAISGDAERERKIRGRIQMDGFGSTDDTGWAVTYLCSPAARYITGVILPVDGGGHASF